jgi:hypothetical protein
MPDQDEVRFEREDDDDRPRRRRTESSSGNGKSVLIVLGVIGILVLLCGGGLFGLLFYSVTKVRSAASIAKEQNDLKQIVLGLHNYEGAYGRLPEAMPKTKDGRPGLSWRVAILPYLEANNVYMQFKLDEPWDSANNLKAANSMPRQFAKPDSPAGTTVTHYRVFVGKGTMFEPDTKISLGRIPDGPANTLLIVEAAEPVPWTKPDELEYQPNGALPALGLPNRDFVLVSMADGSVRRVKKSAGAESWHAAIRRDDGKLPGADFAP